MKRALQRLLDFAPLLLFAVVLAFFGLQSGKFLEPRNLVNIVVQASSTGIVAVGMTFVLLTAGVRQLRFALDERCGIQPVHVGAGVGAEAFGVMERCGELEHSIPIQRDRHAGPVCEHGDVGWPQVPRRPHEALRPGIVKAVSGVQNAASGR